MFEIPNKLARVSVRLEHSDFEFEICFGFRASDFGFRIFGLVAAQPRRVHL